MFMSHLMVVVNGVSRGQVGHTVVGCRRMMCGCGIVLAVAAGDHKYFAITKSSDLIKKRLSGGCDALASCHAAAGGGNEDGRCRQGRNAYSNGIM